MMPNSEGKRTKMRQILAFTALVVVVSNFSILSGALLQTEAQYSSSSSSSAALINFGICDSSRLIRCQQDIVRDIQQQAALTLGQHSIAIGPPYSPRQAPLIQGQSSASNATLCRYVRSNLDCVLSLTPACYDQANLAVQNSADLILRAKRHLEQSGCNEPDTSWPNTFCYRSHEVRNCEERHGFTAYQPTVSGLLAINSSACLAYQAFRQCVDSYSRLQCKVHEMDMLNEYLIDRAAELTWRCPAHNITTNTLSSYTDPYRLSNGLNHQVLVPTYGSSHHDQQRLIPTYGGASQNNLNLFGSPARDQQAWERFRNPNLDEPRYGISRYPYGGGSGGIGAGGSGEVFDRLIAGELDSSDCPVKANPYTRECDDNLLDQQRLARDSRDGNELQRRICCSLFQYRDCISRVVLDRCADSSQTAVELLMGARRREMTLTCRGFNRDICSGSQSTHLKVALLSRALLFVGAILASIMTFKQQQQQSLLY